MTTSASRLFRTVFCSLAAGAAVVTPATAQPSITAAVTPAPNRSGWNNTAVTISYACKGVSACPEPTTVSTEGYRQLFRQAVIDEMGRSAAVSTEISIDVTPASITLTSPSNSSTVVAASVRFNARVTDERSGIATATCNGDPADVQAGEISCLVSLRDGVNDLAVQVTDAAGNSSSTGVQVHRVGRATTIAIVPSELTLLLHQSHIPQVVDNFGRTLSDVDWSIEDPSVVSLAADGKALTAVSAGMTIITARRGALASEMRVRVLPGTELEAWTTIWALRELPGYRNARPVIEVIHPLRVSELTPSMISIEHEIGGSRLMLRALDDAPRQLWIEAPAISEREHIGAQLAGDEMGAGVVRVETADGRSSSLVRVGRPEMGTLWRYTPAARLGDEFAIHGGIVDVVETPADGFPVLAGIDGMTGSSKFRIPLPRSSVTVRNAGCVAGADGRSDRPAEVSVSPTVLEDGAIHLAVSTTDDIEDAFPCQKGTTSRRRRVQHLEVSQDGEVSYRTVFEYPPATGDRLEVVLNKVLPDGHGGQLVAWSARAGRQPTEYMAVRVSGEQLMPFHLPALGAMILAEEDMGVTTDGRTLVGFDVTTGGILWTQRAAPAGSFRLLTAVGGGGFTMATERGVERVDRAGHRVLMGERSK
jgi:hypothetical protein